MLLCVQLYAAQPAKNMNPVAPINQTYEPPEVDRQDSMAEKPSWREKLMTRLIQKRIKKQAAKWEKKQAQGDRQESYKSMASGDGSFGKTRPHWLAVASTILVLGAFTTMGISLAVLSFPGSVSLILALVAIFWGLIGQSRIKQNPEKFHGRDLAGIGIVSAFFSILLMLLANSLKLSLSIF